MHKGYLKTAALLAALAVALGAFGAHGLKQYVPAETVSTFETGVRYQFYHVFALLAVGMLYEKFSQKWLKNAAICFIAGIVLFSGSLYFLTAMKATETVGLSGIGAITPLGGLFFIAGWLCLFRSFTAAK
ncbi:DUF423 domain-containing protein [Pseudoflavitalea sp. G-6-1-2]|uniref:DUF423 domain-containing protein n=1 Tax=Pseudoflavitalea sp. G-6-1-2 TaxID=2728841 RepID=UPI00146D80F6|nr:DUF423 domain-containing protein [Pseudoflavitalea sp. G-6-1-2]NML23193.1 DUF423 domain-containing protein [Pseudoflavitalea sp. G-6-1-2]